MRSWHYAKSHVIPPYSSLILFFLSNLCGLDLRQDTIGLGARCFADEGTLASVRGERVIGCYILNIRLIPNSADPNKIAAARNIAPRITPITEPDSAPLLSLEGFLSTFIALITGAGKALADVITREALRLLDP